MFITIAMDNKDLVNLHGYLEGIYTDVPSSIALFRTVATGTHHSIYITPNWLLHVIDPVIQGK